MGRVEADTLTKLNQFRGILDAIAVGGIIPSNGYEDVRRDLLRIQDLKPYLPEWMLKTRTSDEFASLVRGYHDTRRFIRDELDPALDYLEGDEFGEKPHILFREVSLGRKAMPEPADDPYKQLVDLTGMAQSEQQVRSGLGAGTLQQRTAPTGVPSVGQPKSASETRVFVVHGHDNNRRETVARFIERLGFKPVVLAEQPDQGRLRRHSEPP